MRTRKTTPLHHRNPRAVAWALCVLVASSAFTAQAGHREREQDRQWEDEPHERPEPRTKRRGREGFATDLGPYLGASFSLGIEQFDNTLPGDEFDEGFGFDLWAGSRIHPHVGVEGQLSYLKGFDIQGTGIDFSHLNGTANLKLYPFDGLIQPWVLAGAGVGRFEREDPDGYTLADTGGVMRVGTGVDVYLNDRLSLVGGVGYLFTAGDVVDTDVIEMKFGLQYRF